MRPKLKFGRFFKVIKVRTGTRRKLKCIRVKNLNNNDQITMNNNFSNFNFEFVELHDLISSSSFD